MINFILIGIALTFLAIFFIDIFPDIREKYRRLKREQKRMKKREAFRKKMDELEIK